MSKLPRKYYKISRKFSKIVFFSLKTQKKSREKSARLLFSDFQLFGFVQFL